MNDIPQSTAHLALAEVSRLRAALSAAQGNFLNLALDAECGVAKPKIAEAAHNAAYRTRIALVFVTADPYMAEACGQPSSNPCQLEGATCECGAVTNNAEPVCGSCLAERREGK